ncbi:energy transducer TonB [Chryseobacterium soli]|uniref:energy transducer TonB n=1 Tax=Chryseobacterium soli TaxID=445961 RepID=UPI0029547963|nr:energy transducer TonB [Chryseobacterium soli]MDV7696751.1 energy transducer TonB [Chryseobacterium soli]
MKKLLALASILVFSISYAQVSEFQKADARYDRKIKALYTKYPKANDERTKREWHLTEEKVTTYRNALEKIEEEQKKAIKETSASEMSKISKEAAYETGIASFRKLFNETLALSLANFASEPYKAVLSFVVDSKGNLYGAKVNNGKNEDINLFILAAFYRIKDQGKWKPAESNGQPVSSVVNFPVEFKT